MTRGRAALWIAVHGLAAVAAASLLPRLRSDVRPRIFLDRHDPVRVACDRFHDRFDGDSFVLVTCRPEGKPATEERVGALAESLRLAPGVTSVLVPERGSPLARELVLRDGDSGRVSLLVSVAPGHRTVVDAIRRTAAPFADLAPSLAGQPVLNRALQHASDQVGRRLFPLLAGAMLVLLWLAYRSVRVVGAVFVAAGLTVLYGMATVALLGRPVNLVTILLPVLLLALTVALCIHLANAFRRARESGCSAGRSVARMRREELRPCLLTSLTTAAGFGSFALSRVEPLRVLGVAMAVSILVAFGVGFTLLPALLRVLRPRPRPGLGLGPMLARLVPAWVARRRVVLTVAAVLVVGAVASAPLVPRETNGLHYLPSSHPVRREAERLRAEGVGTASLELVVRAAPGGTIADLAGPVRDLERRLRAGAGIAVRSLLTPLTLAREAAWRLGGPVAPMEAAVFAPLPGTLERRLRPFRDPAAGLVRLSLRIDPMDVAAYRTLRARVETEARQALRPVTGAAVELTGEYPIIMTVQDELLRTLLVSLVTTAATILVVLAVAQRSLRQAALTFLPSVLPAACVVLVCAASGIGLSVSTVMVLAVSLGIVTDDSVHMHDAWARGLSLTDALHRVGTAVTETSIAIFLGFAVLAGAEFRPTAQFGLLTAAAMVAALGADLVFFPVLLRYAPTPARAAPSLAPEVV